MLVRRLLAGVLGPLVVLASIAAPGSADEPGVAPGVAQDSYDRFLDDRPKLLETLAPAFVDCFARRDSLVDPLSPIFHGCYDWHSAVHAAYSHLVLYRRTDKKRYLNLLEAQVAPNGISMIDAEHVYEQAKAPNLPLTENPYGFGWFLVLARERELATDSKDFREMADFAAQQMVTWFETRLTNGDAMNFILNRAHPNYSWSLMNLDVWARYTKDAELLEAVRRAGEPLLEPVLDRMCPVKLDMNDKATGFQPACLMRLAAVAHIQGERSKKFVEGRLPKNLELEPMSKPGNCHAGGLNFTRAFALYQLYRVTGDESLRNNYARLIRYHVGRPDLYIDPDYLGDPGYMCYSHWVAQMGVRAISLSYED